MSDIIDWPSSTTVLMQALTLCNVVSQRNKAGVVCVACHLGKQHKLPFSKSDTLYMIPLKLVVVDVWRPASFLSNGFRYHIVFTDYSRYTWVYFLKQKLGVLLVFEQFYC